MQELLNWRVRKQNLAEVTPFCKLNTAITARNSIQTDKAGDGRDRPENVALSGCFRPVRPCPHLCCFLKGEIR
jgi:hypothetical protein